MAKPKILVTGAGGFIGGAFVEELSRGDLEVFGLSSKPLAQFNGKEFYKQDITREFKLKESFDFVFHLAACNLTHVGKVGAAEYDRVNLQGTVNLLKAVEARHFVFMSTAKVYSQKAAAITEKSTIDPVDDYAQSKLKAEGVCAARFAPKDLTILRGVNVVGPGQAPKAIVPVFFERAAQNLPIEIFVSSQTLLQFVAVSDLLRLFSVVIKKPAGGIFNVAGDWQVRVDWLAKRIVEISRSRSEIICEKNEPVISPKVLADLARAAFDWKPRKSIEDILFDYQRHLQQHGSKT